MSLRIDLTGRSERVKKQASASDPLWYKDAILYELHVRAFADSNGDGIGDFPGLISKLDYLQDLGVTCLWLLPFFPSPLRDDGYDISNYVDVNPSYGTLNDFKAFLDAAHRRNMQVMIELVINHTSDQHPWFKAARLAPPGSAQRNMYVWSDTDQLYKDARIIFTDTEKSNWTWDETAKAYYWHRFFSHQPDLNFDNPAVIEEVLKAMRFWLDMGVDALRMDAIPYLCERDGTSCENLPETHTAIKRFRTAIDADYANRLILAEANQWPADVRPYFGDGDECHMAFHFPLMPRIYMALRQEDRLPITDIMAQTPAIPEVCQWALFLRNHDELTLEMVTADERDYMYLAYSADPRMRIKVGIRRRLAPLVDNNRRRIELLNSLLLSFPGTPVIYYGDEIGMGDNIYLGDRNGVRTPMQWNSDRNAGFSRCDPARLYFPVVMDPVYGYQVINVEAQSSDQSSLLHWTRNMIALRKLFQVFGRGTLRFLNPDNRKILAYLREFNREDGSHETVLCLANLSRFAQPVALDLAEFAGAEPVEMLGYVPFPTVTATPYSLSLAPYSFLWLELQQAGTTPEIQIAPEVASQSIASPDIVSPEVAAVVASVPDLAAKGWSALVAPGARAFLDSALQAWLPKQRWFGAKSRTILAARITECFEIPAEADVSSGERNSPQEESIPPALCFVEVEFTSGNPETYQLPLAIAAEARGEEIAAKYPQSVVANLSSGGREALLHDATVSEEFRRILLRLIEINASLAAPALEPRQFKSGELPLAGVVVAGDLPAVEERLEARASNAFASARGAGAIPSRVGTAEQSNTSILFADKLILKLFRRIQPGGNPDVEIGRFLTDVAHYPHIPAFLGEIAHEDSSDETTLAMLQELVPNAGDGWQWALDRLADFFVSVAGIPSPPVDASGVDELPADTTELLQKSLDAIALLGRRTAELHLALATPTDDAAFAAETSTAEDLGRDSSRIVARIALTMETLRAKLPSLKDEIADDAALLLSRRLELVTRANAIGELSAAGLRIRIHGDYHLGQTLRTKDSATGPGDFVILDFEGEPARPIEERRQKQSPLKDVAGMIRSLSYAAFTGLNRHVAAHPELAGDSRTGRLAAWAAFWERNASLRFLNAYRETAVSEPGASRPALLPQWEDAQPLLGAYLLEKALYELLYELNNRPEWLRIPLAGILAPSMF